MFVRSFACARHDHDSTELSVSVNDKGNKSKSTHQLRFFLLAFSCGSFAHSICCKCMASHFNGNKKRTWKPLQLAFCCSLSPFVVGAVIATLIYMLSTSMPFVEAAAAHICFYPCKLNLIDSKIGLHFQFLLLTVISPFFFYCCSFLVGSLA